MQKLLKALQNSFSFWFLLSTSVVFFLMRLPSFFEPYWYGDEGIYEVLGLGIRHGRLLYRDIWDNKPPLLYLIYALFNGDQSLVKVASFVVGLATLVVFYFLARKLFEKQLPVLFATGLFAVLLGLPLIEGNIANAENFMVLHSVTSALLVLYLSTKKQAPKSLLLFFTGILLGISFLIKVVAVFDFGAFCCFLSFYNYQSVKALTKQIFQYLLPFGIGFILPLLCTLLFFASQGALKTFIQSAFLSNVGYVNYGNQFVIPQGLLIVKLLLLGIVVATAFILRKRLTLAQLFLLLWSSFSVFSALFSQRPYTHYVLVLIASFSLLLSFTVFSKKSFISTVAFVFLSIAMLFIVSKNFYFYNKTSSYYQNFFAFVRGAKTVEAYQQFFDSAVVRDYALANFINSHKKPNDTLFIWGDNAQIYKLTNLLPPGRYTVAYHITSNQQTLQETAKALQQTMPTYVIILGNASPFPYHLIHYQERFGEQDGFIYEKTF